MQKAVVVQFFVLIGAAYGYTEYQPFKKCHALSGEDANINLENAVQTFQNCLMVNKENFRHQIATGTACWSTAQKIEECQMSIAKTVEECGSPDEKHFPKSVFKVIDKYVNVICSRAPDYKFSVLLDHKICFPSIASGVGCLEKFQFFNSTVIVTKDEMCQDEVEVQECFMEYINSTCIEDDVFHQYVLQAFDFDSPPCGEDSAMAIANIKLFTFVMFAFSVIL